MGIESFRRIGVFGGDKGITDVHIRELLLAAQSRTASRRPSEIKEDEGIRQVRKLGPTLPPTHTTIITRQH